MSTCRGEAEDHGSLIGGEHVGVSGDQSLIATRRLGLRQRLNAPALSVRPARQTRLALQRLIAENGPYEAGGSC